MNKRSFMELVNFLKVCIIDEVEELMPDDFEGKETVIKTALKQVSKFYNLDDKS